MARIRTIKPELAQSRSVAKMGFAARYFLSIILCWLDDEGRLEWSTKRLAGEMYPHDEEVGKDDLEGWLKECCDAGVLIKYTNGDVTYVCAPNFLDHQVINRASKSKFPAPNDEGSEVLSGVFTEDSLRTHGGLTEDSSPEREQGIGKGTGKGNKEQGVGSDLHSHILEATTLPSPYQPLTDIQVANIIRTFGLAEADRTQLDGELLRFQDFYTRNPSKSKNPNAYAALTKWLEKVTWRKPPKTAPPRQVASPGLINPGWMEDEHGTA